MNRRALYLVVAQSLFCGRVIGQVIATHLQPGWLPAPGHWASGALPYYALLPLQILLLMLMTLITYDAVRCDGYWHVTSRRKRLALRRVAWFYVVANVARYAITMFVAPELRWTGHGIPIAFHFVLAGYLLVLSTAAGADDRRNR